MARVLVTGFEPFANHSTNISGDLIQTLDANHSVSDPWAELRDYKLDDVEINFETLLLSVDESGSRKVAQRLSDGEEWDVIIHLGLCTNCEIPKIELLAQNILDMSIEDNSGRRTSGQRLGDVNYYSTTNSNVIFTNKGDINAEISFDAGQFVCNETYYHTLAVLCRTDVGVQKTPCLFLHLPDYEFFSIDSAKNLLMNMVGRILFKPVISVAAGVIIDDNRFLVAKRSDEANHGLWEFPGGKFEWGEEPSQAIERELKEEFNWSIISVRSFGKWFHCGEVLDIELNVEFCRFIGIVPDFKPQESWTSHDEVMWIDDEDYVSPYIGIDRLVAKEVSKELSNPSGSFS